MKPISIAAAALLICSCSGTPSGTPADSASKNAKDSTTAFDIEKVKAYINESNLHYSDRFKKNDPAFFSNAYTADAAVMSPDTATVSGPENIRAFFYGGGANESVSVILQSSAIYGTRDLVVEEGAYDVKLNTGMLLEHGKFLATWKEENGTWKIHREMWNSDHRPPAPPTK